MRRTSRSVLPGFGLSLGITCTYLSLIVLLPLATVFTRTADLLWPEFWSTVTDPRVLASYRVTFGASFVAALRQHGLRTAGGLGPGRGTGFPAGSWWTRWSICRSPCRRRWRASR